MGINAAPILSEADCAFVFGVCEAVIAAWVVEGLPTMHHRGCVHFDLAVAVQWHTRRAVAAAMGVESSRDRFFRLQGDKLELEEKVSAGILLPAAAVEPQLRAAAIAAREQLLREAPKLARSIADRRQREERAQAIADVHTRFLRRLASWRPGEADVDDESE